jgi:hypothetical protein
MAQQVKKPCCDSVRAETDRGIGALPFGGSDGVARVQQESENSFGHSENRFSKNRFSENRFSRNRFSVEVKHFVGSLYNLEKVKK